MNYFLTFVTMLQKLPCVMLETIRNLAYGRAARLKGKKYLTYTKSNEQSNIGKQCLLVLFYEFFHAF